MSKALAHNSLDPVLALGPGILFGHPEVHRGPNGLVGTKGLHLLGLAAKLSYETLHKAGGAGGPSLAQSIECCVYIGTDS